MQTHTHTHTHTDRLQYPRFAPTHSKINNKKFTTKDNDNDDGDGLISRLVTPIVSLYAKMHGRLTNITRLVNYCNFHQ